MKSKDHGLTVGQLTMTIGALFIAGLIWSTINNKNESQDISKNYILPSQIDHIKN